MADWGSSNNASDAPKFVKGMKGAGYDANNVTLVSPGSVQHKGDAPGWNYVRVKGAITNVATSVTVASGGTRYANTDTWSKDDSSGTVVTNASGVVTGANITTPGAAVTAGKITIVRGAGAEANVSVIVKTSANSFTITAGGTGYANTDTWTKNDASGSITTDGSGVITAVGITTPGVAVAAGAITITTSTGTGATISAVTISAANSFTVTSGGTRYANTDTWSKNNGSGTVVTNASGVITGINANTPGTNVTAGAITIVRGAGVEANASVVVTSSGGRTLYEPLVVFAAKRT